VPRHPRAPRVPLVVTEEMIEDAIPRDSSHCVFAEAVKAAFPGALKVAVDLQTIRFTDPKRGLRYTYLTPRPVQIAIINFDQGVRPEPFDIQLRNGQVTAAGANAGKWSKKTDKPATPKQRAASEKAAARAREQRSKLSKQTLVARERGSVPDKVGGKPPPMAPGRRRAFGLRGLER
jgi:hypothetical protein